MDEYVGNNLHVAVVTDNTNIAQTADSLVDESFSLRPNYCKDSRFLFNQASSATLTSAGGRKRQRSYNDEVTSYSPDSIKKNSATNVSSGSINHDVDVPRNSVSPQKKIEARLENKPHRRTVILSLADEVEAKQQVTTHCNKRFALKALPGSLNLSGSQIGSGALEPGDFILPPADKLLTSPEWKVEGLQQLKHELNCVKGQTERGGDMTCWTDHTFRVNPAAKVFPNFKQKANPEFISQAFLKFYEVLCRYPVVPSGTSRLSSVHLCEAPGAFIVALNHYLRLHHPQAQWQWLGNTLHPHYEGSLASECIPDDRVILHTLPCWAFGPDGIGDITRRCCLDQISSRCLAMDQPVTLVSADGSIDCQSNPGEQEVMTSHLHFCEVVTGLHILAVGGHMVVKMFTFFEARSISLLFLLCCAFNEVHVFKPITSKLGNSEVYVVSLGYRGRDSIREQLDKLLEAYSSKELSCPIFAKSDLPVKFLSSVSECAKFFMDHQVAAIDRNARLYQNMSDLDSVFSNHLQELIWDRFLDENKPIDRIKSEDGILKVDIRWDQHIYPDFSKQKKWTGCFARFDQEKKCQYVQDQLNFLTKQYANKERQKDIFFVGNDQVQESLRTTKGKPFEFIGTSRFCSARPLNIYITLVKLKHDILEQKVQPQSSTKKESIFFWREDDSHSPILDTDKDTRDLLESIEKDYPKTNFLVQGYPEHSDPPSSSCEALEYLHGLIKNKALPAKTTIHLTNIPLLSRLQNGLFVSLASCFEEVELHQGLNYQMQTGLLSPPVIKLKRLDVTRSQAVIEGLRDVGWAEGAAAHGVMEVIDAAHLISYRSHELVCRYNASLLLVWATSVSRLVQAHNVVH